MSRLEQRGEYRRVKIRRKEFPNQTRSVDTKVQAQRQARYFQSAIWIVDSVSIEHNPKKIPFAAKAVAEVITLVRKNSAINR